MYIHTLVYLARKLLSFLEKYKRQQSTQKMHSFDSELETESSSRKRRKQKRSDDQSSEPSIEREARKIKSAVRSSRDRLSLDVIQGNGTLEDNPAKRSRRKKIESDTDNQENGTLERRRPQRKAKSPQERLPRSVSEEVLALEGKFYPGPMGSDNSQDDSRTRRMKARQRRERSETDPMTMSVDRPPTGKRQHGTRENRKKKKPRSTVFASGDENNYEGDGEVSEIFEVDKEDIIQPSDVNQSLTKLHSVHSFGHTAAPSLPSQPTDILFIEKKDGQGFVREHKSRIKTSRDNTDYALQLLDVNKNYTTLDFVLKIHLTFRSLAMIGHGLLAGLAVSQCVFVYALIGKGNNILLEYYYNLAIPYHSVYYFLLAFSTVSILDRYVNVSSGWSQFFLSLLTKPSRALAVIAYLLALVFSVSLAQLDDRISLYKDLPNLWSEKDMEKLNTWKVINLLRVIGAVLGWIMVAMAPVEDQTAVTIQRFIDQENAEGSVRYEMNSLKSTSIHTWDRINP